MSSSAANEELLAVLSTVVEGGQRATAVKRIAELLPSVSGPAWVRELQYVVRHYSEADPATEEALLTVARQAIMRLRCPVCEQVVLVEPAWHQSGSPSDEICPSCGIQFGYDHADPAVRQRLDEMWRERWVANGHRPVRPKPRLADATPT